MCIVTMRILYLFAGMARKADFADAMKEVFESLPTIAGAQLQVEVIEKDIQRHQQIEVGKRHGPILA